MKIGYFGNFGSHFKLANLLISWFPTLSENNYLIWSILDRMSQIVLEPYEYRYTNIFKDIYTYPFNFREDPILFSK